MTIVLNENEWAEEMIRSRSLGQKPFETLRRVARYYLDKNYKKKEVRDMLDGFLIQCDPSASIPKWANTLDLAVTKALKYEAISIDHIDITDIEMSAIDALEGKQIKRLAFTLLCLSKYWDAVNPNGDHWVNNKDSDIMRMANINTSVKRQSMMYSDLKKVGMIQFSKKVDNTNVRVCFSSNGTTVMKITDFRNLGYQYLKYHGGPYFECQNCGITTKISSQSTSGSFTLCDCAPNMRFSPRQKYCKECASKIAMQRRVNSVMRKRARVADSPGNMRPTQK